MAFDPVVGGPSAQDRQVVYARANISKPAEQHIENIVLGSPGREVGKGALTNVVTRFDSVKNGKPRVLESHTCELICAYELELDPGVVGYYSQAPCRHIERLRQDGLRHVTSANLDFLVFRDQKVELIECKTESWLLKESAKEHSEWELSEATWRHRVYEDYAAKHEIGFSVWSPPLRPGIYLQNLEACYAVVRCGADYEFEKLVRRAMSRIAVRPASVAELCERIDGFSVRTALWMLGTSLAFGPWQSTPILLSERFSLYADRQQAIDVDRLTSTVVCEALCQPVIEDPLLTASATDLAGGRRRLAWLASIKRGQQPSTMRSRQLQRDVDEAVAAGRPALSACITRYNKSGNRLRRLLEGQVQAMENVIATLWNTGRVRKPKNLYRSLKTECERLGIPAPGETALAIRLRRESPVRHALATGGMRGFQSIRTATDPRMRSLPPIGYGHTLHIDSSDLDVRIAKDILKRMPAMKAKFYIGIDGATNDTMAHALIFGAARTDGIAIILREFVRRHGFLPQLIHLDRGPENTSGWMESFAEGYVSLRLSPTAGSAWNGIAENAIRQVNSQVAHQLIGSTEPDQKGRSVDGRFKSYKNAKMSFLDVYEQFVTFIYNDLPNTPGADGQTPNERKAEAIATLGVFGIACALDEAFLLRTSMRVGVKKNVDRRKGIRTEEGYFNSDELMHALLFDHVEDLRSDCEDPTLLRVFIGGRWIRAFHRTSISKVLVPREEKLFDLMYAPIRRAEGRRKKEELSCERHGRIEYANHARVTAVREERPLVTQDENPPQPAPGGSAADNGATDHRRELWDRLALCKVQGAKE